MTPVLREPGRASPSLSPCLAFPQFPLQSFVPGAGLRPREAGDASTKAQQLQPACKVTFAAKGCRSAACQRLPRAQEPGKHGMFVARVCMGGQDPFQEKRRSWCFPALLEAEVLSPSCYEELWYSANLQKNWCYPGLHSGLCHLLPCSGCCFTLQVAGALLSISHLIK